MSAMPFNEMPRPLTPSPWVVRWAHLAPPGGTVLDLAAGRGRHGRMFLQRGHSVTFVDRDTEPLKDLVDLPRATVLQADLEDGSSWPVKGKVFDLIVVTNYLYRPLFSPILDSLDTGGLLLYETFAHGNEAFGRPRNPKHLLKAGELLEVMQGKLQIVAYEHGATHTDEPPAIKQRICAMNSNPS